MLMHDTILPYHSPRNFYKLIPLPFFFVICFVIFYGNSLRPPIFFCNSHALLGESRGLENIFCNFYEINSSQDLFLYCKNFGVDGNGLCVWGLLVTWWYQSCLYGPLWRCRTNLDSRPWGTYVYSLIAIARSSNMRLLRCLQLQCNLRLIASDLAQEKM